MNEDDKARRGDRAKALLTDPLMVEMFDGLERQLYDAWSASKVADVEGRERIFQMLGLARQLRANLQRVVADGEVARQTLAQRARQLFTPARARTGVPFDLRSKS